jgi:beta-ureidopropionase / N-carbamoyl-L-amino-acid hydrolase
VNAVGAQIALIEGEDNSIPPIAMGSHLDSVVPGGRFDGVLGVSVLLVLGIRELV